MGGRGLRRQLGYRGVGVAQHRPRDTQQALVERLHAGLALFARGLGRPAPHRATALSDLEHPARDAALAIPDAMAQAVHGPRQDADAIGQERAVRRIVDVGLDHRGVDAQPPAADDAPLTAQGHEPSQHVLEHGVIEQLRQAHQRLGVGHPFAIDPTEGSIHQAAPHLALALGKAPVAQMLQDEEAQDHRGRGAQSPAPPTVRVARPERGRHTIDQGLVVEDRVDAPKGRIPELVAVREEDLDEAALPVRPPHHGAPGEASRPQSLHRVSCVAARVAAARYSLTITDPAGISQENWCGRASVGVRIASKHRDNGACSAPGSN
jgi:hypothetical protein